MDKQSDYTNKDLEEVQKMFRSAARDCVPQERNSFVAFQANTGVEVCIFFFFVGLLVFVFVLIVSFFFN